MNKREGHPPRLFLRFFRWFCHPELKDYIEGDLRELYEEKFKSSQKWRADLKFIMDVLLLFRPGIIRPSSNLKHSNPIAMLNNYFKITWRNVIRHKGYAAINIAGYSIGIAACIVILLFVRFEKSFDDFHTKNIYRLNEVQNFPGMLSSQKVALSMFPMGPAMKDEFPEIRNFARINSFGKYTLHYGDNKIFMNRWSLFVDSTFLKLFDFKLLEGNRETALNLPNSMVVTRTAAEKIFGREDPLGKIISYYGDDTLVFTVTGVLQDIPQNSHLQFEALYNLRSIASPEWSDNWGSNWLNTYFELEPGVDAAALEKKFPAFVKKHMTEENAKCYTLFLLPLHELHSGTSDIGLDGNNYQKFNGKYTDIFLGLALLILSIACINFMNLSTARSAERAREVGLRKAIGSYRWQLGIQFITESVVLSMVALILAVGLVYLILPWARQLSQRELPFPLFSDFRLAGLLLAGAIFIGVLSGFYPAVYLSGFRPVTVLKGTVQWSGNSSRFRNMLVVLQFSSAIFLMINALFVLSQLRFMEKRDPGFQRSQVIDVALNGNTFRTYDVIKKELLRNNLVSEVTAAQDILGSHLDQSGIEFKGDGPLRHFGATRLIVDPDYLKLYNIPVIEGHDFSGDPATNGKQYIINETLARELLSEEPGKSLSSLLGSRFGFDSLGTIVGIARDFNFNSLHNRIETLFLFNQKDWGYSHMSVKINGARAKDAIAYIQSVWNANCPDTPFQYQFLDDHFTEVYRADSQVSQTVGMLTVLAFIVSCLGLFGLASHSAERRVKEVGIRKVLGASVENIVGMLSRDFLKFVVVAALVALPLAWLAVRQWLQYYAYRIPINLWIFFGAVIVAIFVAFVSTSYQAFRAASSNPVNSLRAE